MVPSEETGAVGGTITPEERNEKEKERDSFKQVYTKQGTRLEIDLSAAINNHCN